MLKLFLGALFLFGSAASVAAEGLADFEDVRLPVGPDAREPSLHVARDGRLLMTWMETPGTGFAVRMATFEGGTWSLPRTVTASTDLFVNWADFPSISEFADGTIIVHWLQTSDNLAYSYDVNMALSGDDGETWSAPFVPHRDETSTQHGFVSLVPHADKVIAVWLDGRAYDDGLLEDGAAPGQMQLRATAISSDGSMSEDIALDFSTCSCCQTAAALVEDQVLVVYRDRSADEVRDISVVRLQDDRWSSPNAVHDDNWVLSGCPVNGPSIAARDQAVAVAWFTGAGDVPAVNVAFSDDAGATFGEPVPIDQGAPIGRLDTLMLDDGTLLVSWVEWERSEEVILVCHVTADGCDTPRRLAANSEGSSVNFPRMAVSEDGFYIAWTQPLPDGSDTIRMLKSAF